MQIVNAEHLLVTPAVFYSNSFAIVLVDIEET